MYNMIMNTKIITKYSNKWVALNSDRTKVLAFAKTILELDKKIKKSKIKDAIYHHVLPPNTIYSP
jgi:TRAP-type mannitol/chloroaromatic compound transport system substrate-binding protein